MQSVIAKDKEPITPFIDQARNLYKNQGVSVILVAGSSGAYFHIADKVIQMDTYRTLDITEKVRAICERTLEKEGGVHELALSMLGNNLWKQNDRVLTAYKVEKKHDQIKTKQFGKDSFSIGKSAVELKYVEQISDVEQTTTLSYVMKYVLEQLEKNPNTEIHELLETICDRINEKGPGAVCGRNVPGNLAEVRRQEIYACVNRYRGFRI